MSNASKRRGRGRLGIGLAAVAIVAGACGSSNESEGTTAASAIATTEAPSAVTEAPSAVTDAPSDATEAPPDASTATDAMRTVYPVDVTDCLGRTTTYEQAPERIATFDPTIAETLIELGLTDKIVGVTQWGDTDWWPATEAEMRTLTIINEAPNYPTKEAVVAASPDIVMSIYPSALLHNESLPNREQWAELGVDSYLVKTGCDEVTGELVDFSSLYDDIRSLGVIFDVQEDWLIAYPVVETIDGIEAERRFFLEQLRAEVEQHFEHRHLRDRGVLQVIAQG